jgi:hypothetical protein
VATVTRIGHRVPGTDVAHVTDILGDMKRSRPSKGTGFSSLICADL